MSRNQLLLAAEDASSHLRLSYNVTGLAWVGSVAGDTQLVSCGLLRGTRCGSGRLGTLSPSLPAGQRAEAASSQRLEMFEDVQKEPGEATASHHIHRQRPALPRALAPAGLQAARAHWSYRQPRDFRFSNASNDP